MAEAKAEAMPSQSAGKAAVAVVAAAVVWAKKARWWLVKEPPTQWKAGMEGGKCALAVQVGAPVAKVEVCEAS